MAPRCACPASSKDSANGILSPNRSEDASPNRVTLQAFVAGMRELGYVDRENIAIERELSEANAERLREAAAELAKRNVDVIVTLSTTAARPAKQSNQSHSHCRHRHDRSRC